MDNTLDENSDDEEEFHSTIETPSSDGDLGPSALLAFHFVLACVALHKRSKSHHGTGPLPPHHPLGVPPFPAQKKGRKSRSLHTEIINEGNEGNLQHGYSVSKDGQSSLQQNYGATKDGSSSNATSGHLQTKNKESLPARSQSFPKEGSVARTQEQPWNAPTLEKFVIKSSTSPTRVESFPLLRRRSRAEDHSANEHNEEDGFVSSPVRVSMDKHLDRGSLNELQSSRRDVKRELDSASDGEGSICTSDICKDGDASLSVLGRPLGSDEERLINRGGKRNMDTDFSSIRELTEDYIARNSTLIKSPSKFSSAHTQRRHFSLLDQEVEEREGRQNGKQKKKVGENLASRRTDIWPGDGSSSMDRRLHKGIDSEGSSADQMPAAGHIESILLWPVGLAVEAIAFQVRLVAQAFAMILHLFKWCNSFTSNRVRDTMQAKDRATEALSQKIAVISNVPPKVTESGSVVLKRAAWGCLAAIYVCILLSMLLFPALFMDFVFLSKIVEEPVIVKEPLHFDYTLSHPAAVVSVHPSERLGNAVGKVRSHQERTRAIPSSHKVHVTVILTLPESDYNRNLGMFQLSAELISANGKSIKVSSRPCMLRFHSAPIRMLKTFLVSLPSLIGGFTESQTLVVDLMEFEEQQIPTSVVQISMQPKAGLPHGHGIPEIYSADLHVESHLPWLKNMMRNWKWTIYIWTGLMLYMVEVMLVLCCCRHALLPQTWMRTNSEEDKAEQLSGNTPQAEVHESGSLDSHLSRRHRQRSLNEHIPTARAIVDRRERKLRPSESHSSL